MLMRELCCAITAVIACAALLPAHAAANLIPNGDFSADSDRDGMADHWQFSGDQGVKVVWSRAQGREGRRAQRLTCTSFVQSGPASHAMLAQNDAFSLEGGKSYRISFNIKGEIGSGVAWVALQQTGPWEPLGLQAMFRVRPEWRRETFAFLASKTISRNLRLQIWFADTGTMWLDDVQLTQGMGDEEKRRYLEVVPDLGAKNLVPNSSFECGASGWGSAGSSLGWMGGLNTLVGTVDRTTAARHASSFRIDLDRAAPPVLAFDYFRATRVPVLFLVVGNRGWIGVTPGDEYTLSAYVRSDPPGVPCALIAQEAFGGLPRRDFAAAGDWQRVSFTFRPSSEQLYIGLGPDLTNSDLPRAAVWVDAVQLERGPAATEYEPRAPVEIGLEWDQPGHLFSSPGEAQATLTAFNTTDAQKTARVTAQPTDFFDRPAAALEAYLALPPGQAVRQPLPLGVAHKGFYRFALASDLGAVIPLSAERFGVIDPCSDSDGLFGMNHAYPEPHLLRLSKQFGLTWFRDWSLKWQEVEPEKGRFVFAETDYQVDRVLKEGLNVLGLLPFPSSEWSSTAPAEDASNRDLGEHARQAHAARGLGEYADYVRTTVRRHAGRIRVWEIMNEPIYTGYALPASAGYEVEDYVAALEVAYQAVKEVDPGAFVVGGIAGHPSTYTQEFIAAGGLQWVDALNLHIYPVLIAPEVYLPELDKLAAMLREAGVQKPLYFTEGSYYGDDDLPYHPYRAGDSLLEPLDSELECASYQVRFDAILLSHGVEKIIYHAGFIGWLNHSLAEGIFFEWDGAPRKMAISQSALTGLLGPDTRYVGSIWDRPRSFAFHSRGNTVVVVWDERPDPPTLNVGPGARLLDLTGAPVTERRVAMSGVPCYLVTDGEIPLARARDLLRRWVR